MIFISQQRFLSDFIVQLITSRFWPVEVLCFIVGCMKTIILKRVLPCTFLLRCHANPQISASLQNMNMNNACMKLFENLLFTCFHEVVNGRDEKDAHSAFFKLFPFQIKTLLCYSAVYLGKTALHYSNFCLAELGFIADTVLCSVCVCVCSVLHVPALIFLSGWCAQFHNHFPDRLCRTVLIVLEWCFWQSPHSYLNKFHAYTLQSWSSWAVWLSGSSTVKSNSYPMTFSVWTRRL